MFFRWCRCGHCGDYSCRRRWLCRLRAIIALAMVLKASDQVEGGAVREVRLLLPEHHHAPVVPHAFVEGRLQAVCPTWHCDPRERRGLRACRGESRLVAEIADKRFAYQRISDDGSKSPEMELAFATWYCRPAARTARPSRSELGNSLRATAGSQLERIASTSSAPSPS